MNITPTQFIVNKRKAFAKALLLFPAFLLVGCANVGPASSPMSPLTIQFKLPKSFQDEVKVSVFGTPQDVEYADHAYVKLNNFSTVDSDEYENYVTSKVAGMGVFKDISASTPAARINKAPDDKVMVGKKVWFQRKDPLTMHQLQSRFANESVLVLETTLREEAPPGIGNLRIGHNYSVAVNVKELKTGKTLFFAEMQGKKFSNMTPTVVDPVLAQVQQWLQQVIYLRPVV